VSRYDTEEPFGVELPPLQDETGNTHKFTGQERDAATGLDYFHARMMASSFGRFTSPDKVGVNAERMMSPQRLNQYVYAANNPVKYYDPNGLDIQLFVRDNSGGGDGNYGHVAIRVYGQGYDYTYDFGRYRLVRGAFNQEGEGIMRVWKDSEAFKKTQQPEGKLTTVDIPTTLTQDKAVMDFFNKETSAGTQLRESPARTIYKLTADYNYKSNNCVTQSLQGLGKIFSVPPLQQNMSGLTQAGFNVIKDDWKPMQVLEDLPEVKQQSPGVTIRGLVPSM
jgi:RHS repeat-associated protein